MDSKKKKTLFILLIIILASALIIGIAYALFTSSDSRTNKFKLGTLDIEILNLDMQKIETSTRIMKPGDIDIISWTSNNAGTSAALTRHTLDIYWKDVADINEITQLDAESLLTLYPSTMTDEEIMSDFNGDGSKKITTETLSPSAIEKEIEVDGNRIKVYGIR